MSRTRHAFRVPTPPGVPRWAVVVSVLVNLAGLVILVRLSSGAANTDVFPGLAGLLDNTRTNPVVEMIYLEPPEVLADAGGVEAAAVAVDEEAREELPMLPEAEEEGVDPEVVEEEGEEPVEVVPTEAPTDITDVIARTAIDSLPRPRVVGRRRRLGPSYGDGRVWAPIELTSEERAIIALSVSAVDSALRERIIAQIRELPPDSFAMALGPQSWGTSIAGQPIGIDRQFITLGPLKIPTVLLALLPMNLPEGNIFDARDERRYEEIRQEIIRQAQRMSDTRQVKEYIAEMRERIDEERTRRRLGINSDSTVVARDTIIPNRRR